MNPCTTCQGPRDGGYDGLCEGCRAQQLLQTALGAPVGQRIGSGHEDPVLRAAAMRAWRLASADVAFVHHQRRPRWGRVAFGGVVALGALGASVGSVEQASSQGGTAFIYWGAVLWGGWIALKGLFES